MLVSKSKIRILDFDIENRPLSYWYKGEPTSEITAIATCWVDDLSTLKATVLGRETLEEILVDFVKLYNEADMVTGHYIIRHDLPTINGALLELGMPQLGPKLVSDTKMHMHKKAGIPATQEYLSEIFNISAPKVGMTQNKWRKANRLTPEGLALTEKRATGDVVQHMLLRNRMLEMKLLAPAKMWRP